MLAFAESDAGFLLSFAFSTTSQHGGKCSTEANKPHRAAITDVDLSFHHLKKRQLCYIAPLTLKITSICVLPALK